MYKLIYLPDYLLKNLALTRYTQRCPGASHDETDAEVVIIIAAADAVASAAAAGAGGAAVVNGDGGRLKVVVSHICSRLFLRPTLLCML